MINDYYEVEASFDLRTFEFLSNGPKGDILKVVLYSELATKGFYSLGFGDKNPLTGLINDLVVTNNNDSYKILSTVAATLYTFTAEYPNATVIATGSTVARTRLYRIGITNNLEAINHDFFILGLREAEWEPFRKNITYDAFLVRRKM